MFVKRLSTILLLLVCAGSTAAVRVRHAVPFQGIWIGQTVSADPTNFPVVSIVAAGRGIVSPLGFVSMVSPHTTDVITGETIGPQIFTDVSGDTVTALCAGFPQPQADGTVRGGLDCHFTSGTGRFAGATGRYAFFLIASPRTDGGPGFNTIAFISGSIR